MNLMNLFAKITLDTSDYDKKLESSGKSAKSFVSKISTGFKTAVKATAAFASAVAIATGVVAKAALSVINFGDDIDKNSQKLGLSSKAYQEWSLALEMAGSDTSTLQTGVRYLTEWTEKLSKGEGDAILATQKLGISYEDFVNMGFDDQLIAVIEALQGVEDQTEKVQLAQEIFGNRTYQELLPLLNQEQGSLRDLFSEMEAGGKIISDEMVKKSAELNDQLTVLKSSAKIAGSSLALEFAPALSTAMEGLQSLLDGNDQAIDVFADGILKLIEDVADKLPVFIGKIADLAVKIIKGLTEKQVLQKLAGSLVTVLVSLITEIINNLSTILKVVIDVFTAIIKALAGVDWGSLLSTLISEIIKTVVYLLTNGEYWKSLLNLGISLAKGIFQALKTFVIETGLKSVWDSAKKWITDRFSNISDFFRNVGIRIVNGIIDGLNKLASWTIPGFKIGNWQIWDDTQVKLFNIPKIQERAIGGMLDELGTYYRVGEKGAEIVAKGSRGTGVANVDQIAQAQYNAMEDYGVREEIQNAARMIVAALERQNRTAGRETQGRRYGRSEIIDALVDGVNEGLSGRGLRTLKSVTSYC